jgi:hypothetical protein
VLIPDLVSVVIPVHNRPALLRRAVASALAQDWPRLAVIVVDDGSDDETPATIASLLAQHPDRLRAVRRAERGGPGAAREAGRRLLRGEFVQYLDSDDVLGPGKLRSQIAAFRAHPDCDICYGRDQVERRTRDGRTWLATHAVPVVDRLFPRIFVDRPWYTFNPLYRRAIVERVGPWMPLWFSEDIEYDSRMAAAGARLRFVDVMTGTLSRVGSDHVSGGHPTRRTLVAWTCAHEAIVANARDAGVPLLGPEVERLARVMFANARRCGEMGLTAWAERLFETACSIAPRPTSPTMRLYRSVARVIGWRPAGVLAGSLDRARAWARGLLRP